MTHQDSAPEMPTVKDWMLVAFLLIEYSNNVESVFEIQTVIAISIDFGSKVSTKRLG